MSVSSYSAGLSMDEIHEEQTPLHSVRASVADLQFLPSSCTGAHLFEIYKIQMRSMGLPAFEEPVPAKTVRVIVFVTDNGPDQKGAQKLIAAALRDSKATFFYRFKCLLHQLHLIVGKQLKRLDGHYSQIAKVVNVWRSTGVASKIRSKYAAMFGETRSLQVAKRLPPRPLKGRWGSISAVEQYLLACGPDELPSVYKAAVGMETNSNQSEDESVEFKSDQIFEMDTATYRKLMGKWRLEAINALQSNSCWLQVAIAFGSRGPVDHLMRWLMHRSNDSGAEPESYHQSKLPQLVFFKLDEIMKEFTDILDANSSQWVLFRTLLDNEDDPADWLALLVSSVLEQASEMNRRIYEYLSAFPAKLVWMIFEEPNIECEIRKAVANELLVYSDQDLDDSFSVRFRDFYNYELKLCCDSGVISLGMHKLLKDPCSAFVCCCTLNFICLSEPRTLLNQ